MHISEKYGTPEYRRNVVHLYKRYLAWAEAGYPEHEVFKADELHLCEYMLREYTYADTKTHIEHVADIFGTAFAFDNGREHKRLPYIREYLSHHAQEFDA